ncbi:hypothetical protein [Schaalia canis]|uniref:hypothetical protein n=1 Tax=Schaalia canis TaxID=100469 RepID=UPI00196A91D5|nr:hypothetical protein [Schaalia canis]
MSTVDRDDLYVRTLLSPLEKSADYLPKMGKSGEVDLEGFTELYGADPLYHWMGLDSPLMFAAHKAAGGMTSIYRQLGIGAERLFRQILRDELELAAEQVVWSYEVLPDVDMASKRDAVKPRILSLDGRVEFEDVDDPTARNRLEEWVDEQRGRLNISVPLKGAVFEVRQGYKSADSKRQNADLANAAQALGHGYLPVLTIMSTQINEIVRARYTTGNWCVLMGEVGSEDASHSTFDFLREVVGYDLVQFFERNTARLRSGTEEILKALLEAK